MQGCDCGATARERGCRVGLSTAIALPLQPGAGAGAGGGLGALLVPGSGATAGALDIMLRDAARLCKTRAVELAGPYRAVAGRVEDAIAAAAAAQKELALLLAQFIV